MLCFTYEQKKKDKMSACTLMEPKTPWNGALDLVWEREPKNSHREKTNQPKVRRKLPVGEGWFNNFHTTAFWSTSPAFNLPCLFVVKGKGSLGVGGCGSDLSSGAAAAAAAGDVQKVSSCAASAIPYYSYYSPSPGEEERGEFPRRGIKLCG